MKHRPGAMRSDFARAKISLASTSMMITDIPADKAYSTMGYWERLSYYGPVCWDSFDQLSRYLTVEHAGELRKILEDSDNDLV